jgi:hypothetical protein
MSEVGAHHACWLLLQPLFITARALPPASTTAVRTNNTRILIAASPLQQGRVVPGINLWRAEGFLRDGRGRGRDQFGTNSRGAVGKRGLAGEGHRGYGIDAMPPMTPYAWSTSHLRRSEYVDALHFPTGF